MKPNRKAIVFDFDGTLINSMAGFGEIAAQVLDRQFACGIEWAYQRYIETSGLPFSFQIEKIFPGDSRNAAALEEFTRLKKEYYRDCPFYSDVAASLQSLKKQGFVLAISSNNEQDILDSKAAELGVDFDLVLGFRPNFLKGRDHFNRILSELGLSRESVVFVGDSLHDGLAASESQIPFIARTGTFTQQQFDKQGIAFAGVSDFSELPRVLEQEGYLSK